MSTLVDQARKVIAALDFVFRDGNVEAVQSAQKLIRELADRVQELESTIQESLKVADPVQPEKEERPCHVFTVTKRGPLTEWSPTSMAFALPDGKHALYTLGAAHGVSPSPSMVGREGEQE